MIWYVLISNSSSAIFFRSGTCQKSESENRAVMVISVCSAGLGKRKMDSMLGLLKKPAWIKSLLFMPISSNCARKAVLFRKVISNAFSRDKFFNASFISGALIIVVWIGVWIASWLHLLI